MSGIVVLLMVLLLVLGVATLRHRSDTRDVRRCFAGVNAFVAESIRYQAAPRGELATRLEAAGEALLSECRNDVIDDELTSLLSNPQAALEDPGAEAIRQQVVAAARRMNESYTQRDERLFSFLTLYVVVILALSVVFVVTRMRGRRQYSRLVSSATYLMNQVSELLRYERQSVTHKPEWAEEEALYEAAREIEASVWNDRQIAGEFVYGNLESFMPQFKERVERLMPCDRLAVAFVDAHGDVIAESAAVSGSVVHLEPGFRESLKDTSLGRVSREGRPRIINDLERHYRDVHRSEGTELVLKEGMRSSLTFPITIRDRCVGFLFISSRQKDAYDESHISRGVRILNLLKQHLYFHYLIQQIVASTANAFVKLMERKDNETSLHIARMSRYSHAIARRLAESDRRVTPTMLREILWFAPLHDIGKIGIPDAVLLKPGQLDPEERRVIEEHVAIGVEVLQSMDRDLDRIIRLSLLPTALDIISGHHEKFDGTGYPAGLAGEDIPLAGRITAVADVFDALTSRRPYKDALSVEKALEIMQEGRGNHFDPTVFDAFLDTMEEIREVYEENKEV